MHWFFFFFYLKWRMIWHLGCQKTLKLLFAWLFFFFLVFGDFKKIIIKSGIFWYCSKISIEVFQHFTLSNFLSCGNALIFMSPDEMVQIRFSHIFLTALNFYLKWYWIISFCAEYLVTLGNVSDSTWFWTSSVHLCQHPKSSEQWTSFTVTGAKKDQTDFAILTLCSYHI